jgi:hypothetical protein
VIGGLAGLGCALRSESVVAAWLAAAAAAVLSLALTVPSQVLAPGDSPPGPVDGRDYDHLALNLARGRGFSYCWSDPEWRAPYERAHDRARYVLHLSLHGPCFPTARRAPGFPALLAAVYAIGGRSFEAGRWLGALALAAAAALGAFLAVRFAGLLAALIFVPCLLSDHQLRFLVGVFMSEPVASASVMAALVAHLILLRQPKPSMAALAGTTLGLLLLVRYHFVLLYGVALLGAAIGALRSRLLRPICGAYGGAALLIIAPWCARNCLVLDAWMPLGTQGGHGLAASYGGNSVRGGAGTWNFDRALKLWARHEGKASGYAFADLARELRSSLEVEREFAQVGQRAALDWLRRNWRHVPAVACARLRAHARGYGILGLLAVGWGLVALAFRKTRAPAALGLSILVMNALAVALTYEEARGRYATPVRPVACLIGSLGLATLVERWLPAPPRPTAR